MSRRMPPTPVAAPWQGSMKDGWWWLSILKTAARPSPMSTAPAFSPGPWITCGASVGSFLRKVRELLYEQCSLHITENIPISVRFGSRPRRLTIFWYSSSVSPCWAMRSLVMATGVRVAFQKALRSQDGFWRISSPLYCVEQREQDQSPVFVAEQRVGATFRVGHHPQDIAGVVDDPRDIVERAVGVGLRRHLAVFRAVAEDHLVPSLQSGERCLVCVVVAFTVGDRQSQHLAWLAAAGEWRGGVLHADVNVLASEGEGA